MHNTTLEMAGNLMPIGQCECEGDMFMYLKSQPENIYNIYCTKCKEVKDFRKIDTYSNLKLTFNPSDILRQLNESYSEELIRDTYDIGQD